MPNALVYSPLGSLRPLFLLGYLCLREGEWPAIQLISLLVADPVNLFRPKCAQNRILSVAATRQINPLTVVPLIVREVSLFFLAWVLTAGGGRRLPYGYSAICRSEV
jgi:hypothetical protein